MGKGDLTKAHIIEKAAPIFNQRGYEGTSLSELMTATGLKKGGIYRHFKNKEDLASAAFQHAWQLASSNRWTDIDDKAGAVDQLKQYVSNFVDKRGGLVPGGCPVLNTAIDSDDGNPALREQVRKALGRWMERIQKIVASGIERGEIRQGVDPGETATVIISTLEGALMISRLDRSHQALSTARAHLSRYLEALRA